MDSRSRGLPFSVSRSRTSYTSSPSTYTSSPLSSSRLYGRDRVLTSDRLPRSSTPFKPDLCQQRYRNLIEESPPWLEPLPTLNSSRDWPWAESPASIRSKQTDSERRTGTYSGLLKVNDDSDFKRAKLSYGSRDTRTSSTSVTAPSYSNIGTGEKTSSWRSYSSTLSPSSTSYSSPSSKPLLTRRDVLNRHLREPEESRYSAHLSSLGESRRRTSALTSLYEPDRLTSSYAQGARPKEPIYSSSSSSTARESYRPRYFPSLDHSARTTADTLSPSSSTITNSSLRSSTTPASSLRSSTTPTSSIRSSTTATSSLRSSTSGLRSAQEQTRNPVSPTVASSPSSSRSSWYTSSVARQDPTSLSKPLTTAAPAPQRPAPAGAEPEGRRSLLSRIFSRRSSQDSSGLSSGSSSRSFDSSDGSPPTGVETAARTPNVTTPEPLALASDRLRRRFFDAVNTPEVAAPESDTAQHLTSHRLRRRFFDTPRSDGDGGGHATWFSSYLRNRSAPPPPPPSSEGSGDGIKEASASRQNTHRRWEDKAPDEDEDDEEDEEEKEDSEAGGASGVTDASVAGSSRVYMQPMPATFRNPGFGSSATPTVTVYPNAFVVGRSQAEAREKDKHVSSRDPERLRKIQERLMLEESDEDEGDLCRICQMGEDSASNPLIEPCHCTGSLQFVHQECIKTWLHSKISSGAGLEALTTCELCKEKLHLNIDNFNIHELHRTHEQSEYEFIRSGLYLVVLLHLYEQRFSDEAGVRTHAAHSTLSPLLASLDEYLDIRVERLPGESSDDDGDEVVVDNRPRIDFSDLDDDLEDED